MSEHRRVVDNPKKPYKVYATLLSVFLGTALSEGVFDFSPTVTGLVVALVASISVYATKNPKVTK